jgi:hypothetical protein
MCIRRVGRSAMRLKPRRPARVLRDGEGEAGAQGAVGAAVGLHGTVAVAAAIRGAISWGRRRARVPRDGGGQTGAQCGLGRLQRECGGARLRADAAMRCRTDAWTRASWVAGYFESGVGSRPGT